MFYSVSVPDREKGIVQDKNRENKDDEIPNHDLPFT